MRIVLEVLRTHELRLRMIGLTISCPPTRNLFTSSVD